MLIRRFDTEYGSVTMDSNAKSGYSIILEQQNLSKPFVYYETYDEGLINRLYWMQVERKKDEQASFYVDELMDLIYACRQDHGWHPFTKIEICDGKRDEFSNCAECFYGTNSPEYKKLTFAYRRLGRSIF